MPTVKRSVIVPYTPEQMFDLVSDVARYPEFMPWCGGADVMEQDESGMIASIMIRIARISQNFTTKNTHDYPNRIQLELVDGPFSNLTGDWTFAPLGEDGCKIDFVMQYEFSSRTLEMVIGPIFNRIATSFIDSFTQRANELYE